MDRKQFWSVAGVAAAVALVVCFLFYVLVAEKTPALKPGPVGFKGLPAEPLA